jgi:hypothetical protein
MLGSNLGQDTSYPDLGAAVFVGSSKQMMG